MRQGESLTLEAVVECIRALLPQGYPSIARTAESLGTSSRTLQRRLQATGVTYRQLVDQVRLDIARRFDAHFVMGEKCQTPGERHNLPSAVAAYARIHVEDYDLFQVNNILIL